MFAVGGVAAAEPVAEQAAPSVAEPHGLCAKVEQHPETICGRIDPVAVMPDTMCALVGDEEQQPATWCIIAGERVG